MSQATRRTKIWLALALLAAVAVAGAAWCLPRLATHWLMTGEPPVVSELMVVPSGGSAERTQTALSLYKAGMAKEILYTGGAFPEEDFSFLVREGVPPLALHPPLRLSASTLEDAQSLRQFILTKGVKSTLVVTSPYHCRRVRLIFSRVLAGLGVRLTVTPSVSLYMDPEHWWRSRQGWRTAGLEFPKIGWAWATVTTLGDVTSEGAPK